MGKCGDAEYGQPPVLLVLGAHAHPDMTLVFLDQPGHGIEQWVDRKSTRLNSSHYS